MSLKPEIVTVGIVPGGSMGEALALVAAQRGHNVNVYRRSHDVDRLDRAKFPSNVKVFSEIKKTVGGADVLFLASPSNKFEEFAAESLSYLKPDRIVCSATKAIQEGTNRRMTQILEDLDPTIRYRLAVLSGPNLSSGMEKGDITGTIIAAYSPEVAAELKNKFQTPKFIIETEDDVVGVEFGGAFKNLVALYAGMLDKLDVPANTKAYFVSKLLNECTEIAVRQGAEQTTFTSLAWFGDIFLCSTDNESRNYRAGEYLVANPGSADKFLSDIPLWLAEGVRTIKPTLALAKASNLKSNETPYLELINNIVHEGRDPRRSINELMGKPTPEHKRLRSLRFYGDRVVRRVGYMAQEMGRALSKPLKQIN